MVLRPIFGETPPTISGGPLVDIYSLYAIHFHWGLFDYDGSEHAIDGLKYAMEAHLIYFRQAAKTYEQALADPKGLAVVGVVAKVVDGGITLPIEGLENLVMPYSGLNLTTSTLSISTFLPRASVYATYKGSLTTPPCSQNVDWIVSMGVLEISKEQVRFLNEILDF